MDAGIDAGRETSEGRTRDVVDFHSLRVTIISGPARGGVHPAKAQELARHSDINLTLHCYTKLQLHEGASAVATLPDAGAGGR